MYKHPIKLIIQKKFEVNSGWNRYYNAGEGCKILLDNNSWIDSEAKLCWYIYRKYGEGRYMILAYKKGKEGFWNFWIGYCLSNGFIRDASENKEVERLQKEMHNASDFEEREMIEEEIQLEKEINKEERKINWKGPRQIKKYRPGILHPYNIDALQQYEQQQQRRN